MNLKEIRINHNLSIAELANLAKISARTIEDIERRKDCKVSTAIILAKALNVSIDDLCIVKGGSLFIYNYHLTDATNRSQTNLNLYSREIVTVVTALFPYVTVNVFNDYFKIESTAPLSSAGLRKMGQNIADSHAALRNLVKTYFYTRSNGQKGQSNQLFKSF